jgi:hypothetical protein
MKIGRLLYAQNRKRGTIIMTENKVNATTPQAKKIQRKIGSTVYEVSLFFNDKSKENMNDKIMRLIRNDPILSTS